MNERAGRNTGGIVLRKGVFFGCFLAGVWCGFGGAAAAEPTPPTNAPSPIPGIPGEPVPPTTNLAPAAPGSPATNAIPAPKPTPDTNAAPATVPQPGPKPAPALAPTPTPGPGATNVVATPPGTNQTNAAQVTLTNQPSRAPSPESAFRIKRGFKINLVATDPLVASPVAMAFDEDSRLFVAEMRDYPSGRDQFPHLGRITILEDPAGEGVFSTATAFATNLPLPSAIACYGGGLLVAAAPNILYLQDTNGNGVADVQRVIYTGFGDTNAPNADGLPHSFYWGLDNRIYGATGSNGGMVAPPQGGAEPFPLNGLDFSSDPREGSLAPETGAALSGMARDDWGRRFLTSFRRPLAVEMIEYRFLQRNPFVVPAPAVDAAYGPAVPIFRYAPPPLASPGTEAKAKTNASGGIALRPITTTTATTHRTNQPAASWMTKARGTVIYRGDLFPTNYRGSVFIADPEAHILHHAVLREIGLQVRAERAFDERDTDFLVSTDPSFRPTQIINGPDGALYVGDMNKGGDSGRIWRISPVTFRPGKLPQLSQANAVELVANLAHTNGWRRDTASRLIFERRDPNTEKLLASVLTGSRQPAARANAMHALAGMGAIKEPQLALLLGDPDPHVRVQAVRLAEAFARNGQISDLLWVRLKTLVADRDIRVRYQAALTAGSISRVDKPAVMVGLLAPDLGNPWMQTAVLNSSLNGSGALLATAASDSRMRGPVAASFLVNLMDMIGASGYQAEVSAAMDYLEKAPLEYGPAFGLTAALGDGLRRARSSLVMVDSAGRLQKIYGPALVVAADQTLGQDIRVDAIRLLGVGPYTMADGGSVLLGLLGAGDNAFIQTTALQSLENYTDPLLVPSLVQRWNNIPRPLRAQAVTTLLARTERIPAVIAMLDARRLPPADFLPWHIEMLRSLRDPNLRTRAVAIFGQGNRNRAGELSRLEPALKRAGNAVTGRQIFESRCTACHTVGGINLTPGPDLAGVKVRGREWILQSIVAPSTEIAPGHKTATVETLGGDMLVGTIDEAERGAILVRRPGRKITSVPRDNLSNLQIQSWSLMPDTVTAGFTEQNMADLLQFLMTVQ